MGVIAKDINALFELFQKDDDVLNEIIEKNPASYLARLLQLHKSFQKQELPDQFIRHTALYAGNNQWFEFLVNQMNTPATEEAATSHFAVNVPADATAGQSIVADDERPAEVISGTETDVEIENEKMGNYHPDIRSPDTEEDQEPLATEDENAFDTETEVPTALEEEKNEMTEEMIREEDNDVNEVEANNTHEQELQEENFEAAATENEDGAAPVAAEHAEPTGGQPVSGNGEEMHDRSSERLDEGVSVTELPKIQAGQESPVVFEPLHTIDYFASQGIKLTEADLSNDRLGRQVKSFTGWLKSMKKLHPGKLPEQEEVVQQIIQSAAEASNIESDVLTEAMAEVLVKQNKKEKAIEMYEKLSLMNPSKSAYFAAKILRLKTF